MTSFSSSSIGAASRPASPLDRHVASEHVVDKTMFTRGGARAPAPLPYGAKAGVRLLEHVGPTLYNLAFQARHAGHNLHQHISHISHRRSNTPQAPAMMNVALPQAAMPTSHLRHTPSGYQSGWTRVGQAYVPTYVPFDPKPHDPLITHF